MPISCCELWRVEGFSLGAPPSTHKFLGEFFGSLDSIWRELYLRQIESLLSAPNLGVLCTPDRPPFVGPCQRVGRPRLAEPDTRPAADEAINFSSISISVVSARSGVSIDVSVPHRAYASPAAFPLWVHSEFKRIYVLRRVAKFEQPARNEDGACKTMVNKVGDDHTDDVSRKHGPVDSYDKGGVVFSVRSE